MRSKLVNASPKTFVIVFDEGEEVVDGLTAFAKDNNIAAASISAIGGFHESELGYYDFAIKDYKKIPVKEQVEVLALTGNIIHYESKPKLHAHVVVGRQDGSAHGGHLLNGIVKPLLEVILTELPAYLHREMDNDLHIPLIKL